jgi:threonine-phosphate decarboxylase
MKSPTDSEVKFIIDLEGETMTSASVNPHGGDIYKASEQYGMKKEDILDYSANINPLGVPSELRKLIISNIDNLVNYPEPECESLRRHIGKYLNIPQENIIIGNGASEVVFLLFDILRPKKILMPAPTFSEYGAAAERYGAEIVFLELREYNEFKLDMGALLDSISEDISAVMLCNPNNPTSTLVSRSDLLRLLEYAKSKDVMII